MPLPAPPGTLSTPRTAPTTPLPAPPGTLATLSESEPLPDEARADVVPDFSNLKAIYQFPESNKEMNIDNHILPKWENMNDEKKLAATFKDFFPDKTKPDDIKQYMTQLSDNAGFKKLLKGSGDTHYFAYKIPFAKYEEDALLIGGQRLRQTTTSDKIELLHTEMELENVFICFPSNDLLVIACRADNDTTAIRSALKMVGLERNQKHSKNKAESSTENTQRNTNDEGPGGVPEDMHGGGAINFGLPKPYTLKRYKGKFGAAGKATWDSKWYRTGTMIYDDMNAVITTVPAQTKMKEHIRTMISFMGSKGNIVAESQQQKMKDMELHVFVIESSGDDLNGKLFVSKYSIDLVNINFPDKKKGPDQPGDNVLTIGGIKAKAQFIETKNNPLIANSTIKERGMPGGIGNLNKKQLRDKLNTMSMKELRKLHKDEEMSTNNNRSIKGLVNNYMRYHNDSNN